MDNIIIIYIKDNYFIPDYIYISKNKLTFIKICNSDNIKHEIKYDGNNNNNNEIIIYPNKSINIKFNLISRIELTLSSYPEAKCIVEVIEENSPIHALGVGKSDSIDNEDGSDGNDDDAKKNESDSNNEYENSSNEHGEVEDGEEDQEREKEREKDGDEDESHNDHQDQDNNYINKKEVNNNESNNNNNNNNNNNEDWNNITYHLNKPKNSKLSLEELFNSDQIGNSTNPSFNNSFINYPNTDARGLLDKQRQEWNQQHSLSTKSLQSNLPPSNIDMGSQNTINSNSNNNNNKNNNKKNKTKNTNINQLKQTQVYDGDNDSRYESEEQEQEQEEEENNRENFNDTDDENDEEKGELLSQREKIRKNILKYPNFSKNNNSNGDDNDCDDGDEFDESSNNKNNSNINDSRRKIKNKNYNNYNNIPISYYNKRNRNIDNQEEYDSDYDNIDDNDENDIEQSKNSKSLTKSQLQNNIQLLKYKEVIQISDYDFNRKNIIIRVGAPVEFLLDPKTPSHVEHVLEGRSLNSKLCFMSEILQLPYCDRYVFTPMVPGEIFVSCQIYSDMACRIVVLNPPPQSQSQSTPTSQSSQSTSNQLSSGIYDSKRKIQQHTQIYSPRTNISTNLAKPLSGSFPINNLNSFDQLNSNDEQNNITNITNTSNNNSHNLPPFSPNPQLNNINGLGSINRNINNINNINVIPLPTCILGVSEKLYIQPYHHSNSGPWSVSSYGDSASITSSCLDSDDCPDEELFGLETTTTHNNTISTTMSPINSINMNYNQEIGNDYELDENNRINNDNLSLKFQLNESNQFDHIVYVEDFKFQPSQIEIYINQTIIFQSIGHASMHKLSCFGEFDGITLDSNNSLLTSSYYIHQFTNIGEYRVTNEIFSFMECKIVVHEAKDDTNYNENNKEYLLSTNNIIPSSKSIPIEFNSNKTKNYNDKNENENNDNNNDDSNRDEVRKYYQYIEGNFVKTINPIDDSDHNKDDINNNKDNIEYKETNNNYENNNNLIINSPTRKPYDLMESISPPKVIQNHLMASVDWGLEAEELSDEETENKYQDTTSILLSSSLSPSTSPITTTSTTTSSIEKSLIEIETRDKIIDEIGNNFSEVNDIETKLIIEENDDKFKKNKKNKKLKKKGLEVDEQKINLDSKTQKIINPISVTNNNNTTTNNKIKIEQNNLESKKLGLINEKSKNLKDFEIKNNNNINNNNSIKNEIKNEELQKELSGNISKSETKIIPSPNKAIPISTTSTTSPPLPPKVMPPKISNNLMNLLQTASDKKRSQDLSQIIPINKIDEFLNKRWENMMLKLNHDELDKLPTNKLKPIIRIQIE